MPVATRFEELIAWQLCAHLQDEVFTLTEDGSAARDLNFKTQIRKSTRSSSTNLAEGFGAFYPREFARFGRIARRSIIETRNHLIEARKQKYFSNEVVRNLIHLTFRAQKATTRLIKYLDSCKGRPPTGWNFERNEPSL